MKRKRLIILLIVVVVLAAAAIVLQNMYRNIEANLKALSGTTIAQVDLTQKADGTYKGSYSVFPVSAKVSVTVTDHKITAIELVEHKNGQGAKAEVIPERVLTTQSLQVDSIAGATYSSKVILKAIENALSGSGQ